MGLQTKTFSYGSLTDKSILNGYLLELTLTERSVDAAQNISYVDFSLKLRSGSKNRFTLYGLGAAVLLDGKTVGSRDRYTAEQVSLDYNSVVTLVSGSATIAHDDSGSKTVAVAFSIDMKASDYTPGPVSVTNKTWKLTAIPRAGSITATDANIGGVSTLVVDRKSADFTHTIHVQFGSYSGYLNSNGQLIATAEKLEKTTLAFVIPDSFYGQIPNSPTGKCQVTCTTYSPWGQVGQTQCAFTVTAARSVCTPKVEAVVADANPETIALTGNENTLVRYASTARCAVTATAENSATITSLTVNGKGVENGIWESENTEETTFLVACRDSRGYETTTVLQPEIVPYRKLTCNLRTKRLQPTDNEAQLIVSGNCFGGSFGASDNELMLTYTVGEVTTNLMLPVENNTYQAVLTLTELDYTQAHAVAVQVQDKLQKVQKTVTVQPGIPVFDWGREDFAFHVPVSIQGHTIRDFIVEQADVDGWYYRKWSSGFGECWYRKQLTVDVTTPIGSLYTSGEIPESNAVFPFVFKTLPSMSASLTGVSYAGFLAPSGVLTRNNTGAYQIMRPTTTTAGAFRICYYAAGQWE